MDVGSTTVKATVVDPNSKAILWSDYQRHHTKQPEKVLELLETILKALHRDTIIDTGAWTNMSIEHTARTGADKGYVVITPEDCCSTMNADWHNASISFALQNVSVVTNADAVMRALG